MNRIQRGLTMIEVLVALLVLAVGLLGVAGMQTVSMQQTQEADRRSVAVLHVQSMADEIRSNRGLPSNAVKTNWEAAVKEDLGAEGTVTKVEDDVAGKSATVSVSWSGRVAQWDGPAEGEEQSEDGLLSDQKFELTVRYAQ